jgi:predicted nucleic acid-binding protein
VRDILLHIAAKGWYQPKRSSEIHDEWLSNLVVNRPDLRRENLNKTVTAMNAAFPDADVTNYEDLIRALNLPDENDRHVMAVAIRGKANVIVTENSVAPGLFPSRKKYYIRRATCGSEVK